MPLGTARHERVATAGLCGGRTHGILEIRPGRGQRPPHDVVVDGRDAEHADESLDALVGKFSPTSLLQDMEDGGHAVGRNHIRFDLAGSAVSIAKAHSNDASPMRITGS